ncbi:AarF/UbiB family protein [Streptomyces sp. HNM0663]|uniref:AarF/UbiB family protein n=1 Tax=Streptomyces chengmaiensis TaxID=3040919 RepID=A0ABT6HQE0_9ACTN|nr:AarF/UbiB family protein [Streptomyces chengmaiensis]MDH2390943.1 AarF/UbiB family protein [Streptomyces chengmaiensis]
MWILGAVAGAFTVMVLPALLGRRLLGVEAGPLRTVIAGFAGISVSGSLIAPQLEKQGARVELFTLMAGVGLLAAMVTLVVLDLASPPGGLRPLSWAGRLRGRIARVRRYSRIVRIAGRHGLGPYLSGRGRPYETRHELLAQELRQALQAGGATFVKLGQLMSTRRDLLPAVYVEELSRLQDRVEPAPWPEVEQALLASLGAPPEEVFAAFDRMPLAAASIAQVHAAVLHDGARVIVKVQRPGIRDAVERDLDIVNRLAATLQARTDWGRALRLPELAQGFAVALREELDFRVEARNITAVRQAAAARGDRSVALPELCQRLSSERVLVMSRIDGVPLGQAETGGPEHGKELADTLFTALLNQIVHDGVFHADPHPGNILLRPDGTPALLDFGSVGRIDAGLRDAMAGLFLAVDRGDPAALRDALLEVTDRPEDVDEQRLQRALGQFSARHLGHGSAPGSAMFTDLFRLVTDFRLAVPPEIAAVFRALGTLEGTLERVASGFNMLAASRAYAAGQLTRQLGTQAARETVRDELLAVLPVLRRLPRRLDRIGSALEEGRLGVGVRLLADPRDRRVAGELLSRVLLTFLGIFFGVVGVQLLGTEGGPQVTDALSLYALIGYHLLVLSAAVVIRTVYVLTRPLE